MSSATVSSPPPSQLQSAPKQPFRQAEKGDKLGSREVRDRRNFKDKDEQGSEEWRNTSPCS